MIVLTGDCRDLMPPRGPFGDCRLHDETQFEDLGVAAGLRRHVTQAKARRARSLHHERTSALTAVHQPLCPQSRDGLPHHRPAHSKLGGELGLGGQATARRKITATDAALEVCTNLFGETARAEHRGQGHNGHSSTCLTNYPEV